MVTDVLSMSWRAKLFGIVECESAIDLIALMACLGRLGGRAGCRGASRRAGKAGQRPEGPP
jgi:hypothetical protein